MCNVVKKMIDCLKTSLCLSEVWDSEAWSDVILNNFTLVYSGFGYSRVRLAVTWNFVAL